ncbi:hypothetical protein CU098_011274, partial [Rhizopus stolonifer]
AIAKHEKVESLNYYTNLAAELQKFPVRRRDPHYSKRLADRLRDAKKDYYKTSRELRKREKQISQKIRNTLITTTEDLYSFVDSTYKSLESENNPISDTLCLTRNKLDKKCFDDWSNILKDAAREIRHRIIAIPDPTDYDHYVAVLKEHWNDALIFHDKEAVLTEIAEDTIAKLFNLPTRKESMDKKTDLDSLVMTTLQSVLQDTFEGYSFKNIKNYSQLESMALQGEERNKRTFKRRRITERDYGNRLETILKEVDGIIVPAYNRGELFCQKYLEKMCVQLGHVNEILQNHSEIIKVLANPDDKNLSNNTNALQKNDTLPTVISYIDEECYVSTALGVLINRCTKQNVSEIQEKINHLQEQINNLPNER